MRSASSLRRIAALKTCGKITGIETVTGGGGVDRHHNLRHRHEFLAGSSSHQRTVESVLDDDFADAECLQTCDRRLRAGIAPEHSLVMESRQRNIDALERFDE